MLQIPQEIIGLLPPLQHLGIAGYWFILLITFAEAFVFTGWVVPGTVLVVLAGGLAAHGVYDIGYLMVFATIGAILGDSVSYELGRRGRGIIARFVFLQKRVERGRAFFREHQGKSIFLGRFIGWIRPIVPFIAGLMGMKRIPFYIINILSAVAWAIAYLGLGYIFGAAGKIVLIGFAKISLILLLPSLPFVAIFFLWGLVLRRGKIILRVTISIVCSLGKGLRENEYVRRWLERHQRLSTFLHARISIATFQGLPLSLLLLATIYSFSIFSGLVEDYLTNAPLVALDVRLANLFYAFRDEELVQVFYAITALANVTTVLVAVLFLTGILWWQRRRITVATLWIAFLGSEGMTTLGKFLVHRQRPASFLSVLLEDSYSFPSGHATSAVVLFGFLAYLIIREHRSWRVKVSAFFAAIILIFLIDLSRLYLGVHYLSDVLAGNMLSCSVLLFAISTGEWIQARQKKIMKPFIWKTIAPFPFLMALLVGVYVNIVPLTPKTIGEVSPTAMVPWDAIPTLFSTGTLPRTTETLLGNPQEPVNLLAVVPDGCLVPAFLQAGWHVADSPSARTTVRMARAALFDEAYPTAPMTPSFYDTQPHTLGFEKETEEKSVRSRHHARFWATRYRTAEGALWVGTASLDTGVKWVITHSIAPDIDTERTLVVADLEKAELVTKMEEFTLVPPTLGKNFSGDAFFTDGRTALLRVKGCER